MGQDYFVDPDSGAWIFPPNQTTSLMEENAKLKTLLSSILGALPADVVRKIPAEHMEVVDGSN